MIKKSVKTFQTLLQSSKLKSVYSLLIGCLSSRFGNLITLSKFGCIQWRKAILYSIILVHIALSMDVACSTPWPSGLVSLRLCIKVSKCKISLDTHYSDYICSKNQWLQGKSFSLYSSELRMPRGKFWLIPMFDVRLCIAVITVQNVCTAVYETLEILIFIWNLNTVLGYD